MKTKTVVFSGPRIVELREEALAPLGEDQFLLRAEHSLISTGTETIVLQGEFEPDSHWDNWVKYPFYPGYCMVGTVEQVGAGCTQFAVGDRVATRTGHRSLSVVPQAPHVRAVKVPDGVSPLDAAWFGMATIAQNGVRRARHELGDNVVIIGAGLLGQFVTQYLRIFGAREIIVVDVSPKRLDLAAKHGASHTLQMGAKEATEAVFDLTRGRGADVVYDVTGHPAVFASALGLAKRFGTLLLLGDTAHPGEQRLTPDVMTRGVQIIAAHDGHPPLESSERDYWSSARMAELFFHFLQSGQMRVSDLVTHTYQPHQAPEAYEMLLRDRSAALGVLFDWR